MMAGNGNGNVWRWMAVILGTVVIALLAATGRDITGRLSATEEQQGMQSSRLTAVETNQVNILRITSENSRKLDRLLEQR